MPEQVIPILRAGLIMLEQAATMLPASQTFHVGYERNEETLQVLSISARTCKQVSTGHLVGVCEPGQLLCHEP